ncbi:hypothetical protein EJ08DRAFT_594389 [Tothia fuscella]|uniref:Uncharacterized protein n=1 Tax=Tothia fuscella TaxID=1048955 RepID=A0A9P4TW03_9PEZI|nr:hypothetical protein EJ08DRAFT_594389 [Tothia fuscella]
MGEVPANIVIIAGGGIPNVSGSAVQYTQAGIVALQLLATLENIEAFFYAEAIHNLTTGAYTLPDNSTYVETVEVISKIAAQEAVHVATVGAVLRLNFATVVPPCQYAFPVQDFGHFLTVANLLTSTNFGSVIGVQEQLSGTDLAIASSTTSIIAVEARHDAFLRIMHGLIPNPSPFDSGLPVAWAYNIGLQLIVPGSCPVEVPLPTYPQLFIDGAPSWENWAPDTYPETMGFKWDDQQEWVTREAGKQIYAAWVNLYNQPVYTNVTVSGKGVGTAEVPKDMQAVAYVALTTLMPDNFAGLQDATLAGPLAIAMS